MAKTPKRELGDKGEDVVCRYLEGRGYQILGRNYLKPWGEIDIIAKKAAVISFVEVKSVSRDLSGKTAVSPSAVAGQARRETYRPEDNMHPAKVKRLHRAIQTYLIDHKVGDEVEWQLDLACVFLDLNTHKARVEMLENVVL